MGVVPAFTAAATPSRKKPVVVLTTVGNRNQLTASVAEAAEDVDGGIEPAGLER
ncbi:MAG: hypothetical protein U1E33_05060 [Rhodospirillales bacterium]